MQLATLFAGGALWGKAEILASRHDRNPWGAARKGQRVHCLSLPPQSPASRHLMKGNSGCLLNIFFSQQKNLREEKLVAPQKAMEGAVSPLWKKGLQNTAGSLNIGML